MNALEAIEIKKIERIKELLSFPAEKRNEKILLEIMCFTKNFRLFENLTMSEAHKNISRDIKLINFKKNDIIYKQGDYGDSFFFILSGTVDVFVTKNTHEDLEFLNIEDKEKEKHIGELKRGQSFGELSLIYGVARTTTIIASNLVVLIKLEKSSFDKYVPNFFEQQVNDLIEFLKICPIFYNCSREILLKLAIRSETKKYNSNTEILRKSYKTESIYLIRRGFIKVVRTLNLIKDESNLKNKIRKESLCWIENLIKSKEFSEDKFIEVLSIGPSEEDIKNENYIKKNIGLETLKTGDIFPCYFCVNNISLSVDFIAESPCEVIIMKISDIQELLPEAFTFIKNFSKPYPEDDFLRKFYYYNIRWLNFKNNLKHNIKADLNNKKMVDNKNMRNKFIYKKDLNAIKLPSIFNTKSYIN